MMTSNRGSRDHILSLVDSPHYTQLLNAVLKGHAVVTPANEHRPQGRAQTTEWEIPRFCQTYCQSWFSSAHLDGWWLPDQAGGRTAKGATWDLLSTCQVSQRQGLLLVEAKAHESELDFGGKVLGSTATTQSQQNHQHISRRLSEIAQDMRRNKIDVRLGAESHYQLANRVAWAWKLADSGIPVVLLYFGFTGDAHFNDYFRDADHWQRAMGAYMHGVIPKGLPGKTVSTSSGGSFTMLVESIPVQLLQTTGSRGFASSGNAGTANPNSPEMARLDSEQTATEGFNKHKLGSSDSESASNLSPAWISFYQEAHRLAELIRQRRAERESLSQSQADEIIPS